MNMKYSDENKVHKGFTLLEVSITMTILGILMVFVIQAYSKYRVDQVRRITVENVKNANTRVVEFLTLNARYPCPAPLNVQRDNPNYGLEGNCTVPAAAEGACDAQGVCVEEGARLIAALGDNPTVRRGALPFRSLNIPESMAYDGYGNRIQYAVTERLTDSGTYDPSHGAIEIVDANDVTVLKQPGIAQFIVLSTGVNGEGGYTADGVRVSNCAGTAKDVENCNTSATNSQAVYRAMVHDMTAANYYDDVVAYDTTSEAPAWKYTDSTAINAQQVADDKVAVFDTAPIVKDVRLDVAGDLRVDGQVQAVRYCTDMIDTATPTNESCFETDKIAGDIATGGGMECPAGTVMTGISDAAPICRPVLSLGGCPTGQILKGVAADLSPICEDPPISCPAYTYSNCGESYTYPATLHGGIITSSVLGFSYQRRLRCSGGSWQYNGSWGHCSCTPGVYTQNYSCGTGYTGRRYRDITTTCNVATGTRTVTYGSWDRSACVCVGATSTETTNCPSDMAGTRTRTRTMHCPSGNWSYSGWSPVATSCSCVPRPPQTRTVACDGGFDGTKTEEKAYLCPAAVWDTNWTEVANNCTCNPAKTDTKSANDCPSGQIGEVYYQRTTECHLGGNWGPWVEISNTCRAQTCVWRALGTSTEGAFGIGAGAVAGTCSCGRANTACYLQKGAGSFDNYSECACELQL